MHAKKEEVRMHACLLFSETGDMIDDF